MPARRTQPPASQPLQAGTYDPAYARACLLTEATLRSGRYRTWTPWNEWAVQLWEVQVPAVMDGETEVLAASTWLVWGERGDRDTLYYAERGVISDPDVLTAAQQPSGFDRRLAAWRLGQELTPLVAAALREGRR